MSKRFRLGLSLVATSAILALGSLPAAAASMYAQVFGPDALGYVDGGAPLHYLHDFDLAGITVLSATLLITTTDQPGCLGYPVPGDACDLDDLYAEPETAQILVAGQAFAGGPAGGGTFYGDVTGALLGSGGTLDVSISAPDGDFYAWRSVLMVSYDPAGGGGGGGPVPTIPEPSAAVLFGVGSLAIASASRRR